MRLVLGTPIKSPGVGGQEAFVVHMVHISPYLTSMGSYLQYLRELHRMLVVTGGH